MTERSDARPATTMMCALVIVDIVPDVVMPDFTAAGGDAEIVWDPTVALMKRIENGERADGIFAIDWAIDELENRKMIVPASRRTICQASFGISIAKGAARPDISNADALKKTLLDIGSIAYSRAGASGIYFEKLIDQLGIGDEVRAKSTVIPAGFTGELVARGEADLAVQQVSELLSVKGIEFLGPMPPDVQQPTDFSAAVFEGAENPDGAARFIELLATPAARSAYEKLGLVPRFD